MVWNDMQWYSYSLPFLLMQWYARICFAFTYIAIPPDAMICKDMFCIHIHCHSCWCKPFEWIRIEWIRIAWIRMETIRIDRIRAYLLNGCALNGCALNGYVLNGYVLVRYVLNGYVLVGYVLVGYVLNGYVWDMCGVRYANNLLKNPATKRLSGKSPLSQALTTLPRPMRFHVQRWQNYNEKKIVLESLVSMHSCQGPFLENN